MPCRRTARRVIFLATIFSFLPVSVSGAQLPADFARLESLAVHIGLRFAVLKMPVLYPRESCSLGQPQVIFGIMGKCDHRRPALTCRRLIDVGGKTLLYRLESVY